MIQKYHIHTLNSIVLQFFIILDLILSIYILFSKLFFIIITKKNGSTHLKPMCGTISINCAIVKVSNLV